MKYALILALVGGAATAHAADLGAPFELQTSQVLPSLIGNARFKDLSMSIDSKYNGIGGTEPLAQPMNKQVTWNDIMNTQADANQKAQVAGLVQAARDMGDDMGTGPGQTTGQVNTYANVKVPILAFGVTDQLTLAAALPIFHVEVAADTGFIRNASGEAFVRDAAKSSYLKSDEAAGKLNNAVNTKLAFLGYQTIPSSMTVDHIGDVPLVAKYNFMKDDVNSMSVAAAVTLPTGIAPDPDKALDVPTGDGQTDIGATVIYDRMLTEDLRWNTYGGYNEQLPDHIVKRLPAAQDDPLSADKQMLWRKLGDQVAMGTSLNYHYYPAGLNLGAGYSFQYQMKTTYSGSGYDPIRYRWLEGQQPVEALHAATLQGGFSTVEWFQRKKFAAPFQLNVVYSKPLAGRNVTKNDVVAGELVLFF